MKLILATLTVIILAGCAPSNPPPPETARLDPYAPPQVVFAADGTQSLIYCNEPQLSTDQVGILHIVLPIRSIADDPIAIDYRVRFFDRENHPMGETGAWATKHLTPNVPDLITVNANRAGAANFQLDIRRTQ